jgi:DNA-binding MarR family transcriptional regulator
MDALVQVSFAVQAALGAIAAERDLSLIQLRLLGVLRDRAPTMNDLARVLGLDKSSVTGLVDRAESRGLVRREGSPTDRRAIEVRITAAGRKLVNDLTARAEARIDAFVAPLATAEKRTLSELVSRILVEDARVSGIDLFTDSSRLVPLPRDAPEARRQVKVATPEDG